MTATPNPTAEQIVAEAMVDAGAPLMGPQVEEAVVAALRAHGRLSEGAPSEEQIERAVVAATGWDSSASLLDAVRDHLFRPRTQAAEDYTRVLMVRLADALRAALTAASVAPHIADDAVVRLRALGLSDREVLDRLAQATMLAAAPVSEELVHVVCKVAATGRVTNEDIVGLGRGREMQVRLVSGTTPSEGRRPEMSDSSVVAYHQWRKNLGWDRLSDDEGTAARIAFYAGWDWGRAVPIAPAPVDGEKLAEELREWAPCAMTPAQQKDLLMRAAAALAVSPVPARDDATALRLAAQNYPFTLLGVGTTWREAQKALIERADGIDALTVTEEERA